MSPTASSAAPLAQLRRRCTLLAWGLLRPAGRRRAPPATAGALPPSQIAAGAYTWAFCGVLWHPVAGSFRRLASTGPRTHPQLWPRLPQGHRLLRARRQPPLTLGATGLRAEIHRELSTSCRLHLRATSNLASRSTGPRAIAGARLQIRALPRSRFTESCPRLDGRLHLQVRLTTASADGALGASWPRPLLPAPSVCM